MCILFCLARLAAEIRGNEVKSLHDTSGSLYSHNLHTSFFKGPPPRDVQLTAREIEFSISNFVRLQKLLASLLQLGKQLFCRLKTKFDLHKGRVNTEISSLDRLFSLSLFKKARI